MNPRTPKKILVLAEHFAPAYKAGGIVRSLENLVRTLDGSYRFDIITGNTNLHKTEMLKNIADNRWTDFTPNSGIIYLSRRRRTAFFLKRSIALLRPDCLYINGMFSPFFTLLPLLLFKFFYRDLTVIVAPRGMLHKGNLQLKKRKKGLYFRFFKIFGLHEKVRWHATDDQEAKDIKAMFGNDAQVVMAQPLPVGTVPTFQPIEKNSGQLKLATISLIAQKKGHLELIRTLKAAQHKLSAELHLYGPIKDEQTWEYCQKEMKSLSDNIKVFYHGFIPPQEVCSRLSECHFFVLLSSGENFCHAAYESLKAGRPLIISNQTPWRNLTKQKAGWDISLQDKKNLLDTLERAYDMNQSAYNAYCKGAQKLARRFLQKANFERQYRRLFE